MYNNTTSNHTEGNGVDKLNDHFRKTQLVPFCIIMVVGIFTNIVVITSGVRRRHTIKHYSNFFVISMAVADLGVVVMQVPIAIFEFTIGIPNISQFTCKYIIQMRETFQGAAILSISFLALIRARHIMSYPKKVSKRTCVLVVLGIWLLSYLLCTLPMYYVYKVFPDGQCDADWRNKAVKKAYITLLFCIMLLPMVIATISYTYVMVKIRSMFSETLPRRKNVTLLLLFLVISCWISYVPIAFYFMLAIHTDVHLSWYAWSVASIFFVGGSALNPVLVLLTMPREYGIHCKRNSRVDRRPQSQPQFMLRDARRNSGPEPDTCSKSVV